MKGMISRSFYEIQSYYLADAQSYTNGHDWTKAYISKILQITHSQWIYRNISFHEEELGHLRRKEIEAMKFEAEEMVCTNPAELPEESRLLLKMDGIKNSKNSYDYHDMNYCMGATRAAKKAGRRISSLGEEQAN